jgi:hypothetical protein
LRIYGSNLFQNKMTIYDLSEALFSRANMTLKKAKSL